MFKCAFHFSLFYRYPFASLAKIGVLRLCIGARGVFRLAFCLETTTTHHAPTDCGREQACCPKSRRVVNNHLYSTQGTIQGRPLIACAECLIGLSNIPDITIPFPTREPASSFVFHLHSKLSEPNESKKTTAQHASIDHVDSDCGSTTQRTFVCPIKTNYSSTFHDGPQRGPCLHYHVTTADQRSNPDGPSCFRR